MAADELPARDEVPAAHLEGLVTPSGWTIGGPVQKLPGATGGHFSISYFATDREGRTGFLKALNFHEAFSGPGSMVDRLKDFTTAFVFERDLLAECGMRKMSRIIRMLDSGSVIVLGVAPPLAEVPYLIFERADGDIRRFQEQMGRLDLVWTFRVMKHTCEGVEQLHSAQTAHQDLKPSNVLTLEDGDSMKLGDLGRADRRGVDGPCSDMDLPGAVVYAPPEQHYGAFTQAWEERRAADMYLTGSLAFSIFIGHCLSALLQHRLPEQFRFHKWNGGFDDVLPPLKLAHNHCLEDLAQDIRRRTPWNDITEEFVVAVGQLTDPDPEVRGHPKDRASKTSSYNMRRYVSLFNKLSLQARFRAAGSGE